MSQGFAELDALIERIQSIPGMAANAAQDLAAVVQSELESTIGAGQDPYGTPWAPRKADGSKPLQNAAAAITVQAYESVIFVRVIGPEARHHRGQVKGGTKRRVIPIKVIPPKMAKRLVEVLTRRFQAVTSG
jgi:hypothetical protein